MLRHFKVTKRSVCTKEHVENNQFNYDTMSHLTYWKLNTRITIFLLAAEFLSHRQGLPDTSLTIRTILDNLVFPNELGKISMVYNL